MKRVTEFLATKGFLFSDFKGIKLSQLESKKKIEIYSGCDTKKHFISVFVVEQKARFILKNAKELELLRDRLKLVEEHNFKQNLLLIKGEMCSKSIKALESDNWKIYNDFM
jgi:hypothetical protein